MTNDESIEAMQLINEHIAIDQDGGPFTREEMDERVSRKKAIVDELSGIDDLNVQKIALKARVEGHMMNAGQLIEDLLRD